MLPTPPRKTSPNLLTRPAAAALVLSLSACAQGPAMHQTTQSTAPVTHNCQPQETVGFSCELRDHRLLSLCASPDFLQFKGNPIDNPGYAYIAVGSPEGKVQYSFPEDPKEYKKHMYLWVSLSAAPHMFISGNKGPFFHFSLDEQAPADVMPKSLPTGWSLPSGEDPSVCESRINREHLDSYMGQMMDKGEWTKSQTKSLGQ